MAMVKRIDHVAVAVKDLGAAVRTFTTNFGFPVTRRSDAPGLGIALAMLGIGDAQLELFTPTTTTNAPAKFLAERDEGMYLLSLETDDLDAAVRTLSARGLKTSPVTPSADGKSRLVFVSPRSTHGVLLELIEHAKA